MYTRGAIFILAKIKGEKSVHNFLSDKQNISIFKREDNIFPTGGYEFLAHLVHQKLIHNIITTNFDEELEISLDDEIGRDNYIIVKSLSEFDAFSTGNRRRKYEIKKTNIVQNPWNNQLPAYY